jgi:hypothetical protein
MIDLHNRLCLDFSGEVFGFNRRLTLEHCDLFGVSIPQELGYVPVVEILSNRRVLPTSPRESQISMA